MLPAVRGAQAAFAAVDENGMTIPATMTGAKEPQSGIHNFRLFGGGTPGAYMPMQIREIGGGGGGGNPGEPPPGGAG
jgi:hypothetical protein